MDMLRKKLDDFWAGSHDISTAEMMAFIAAHTKRSIDLTQAEQTERLAKAQGYVHAATTRLLGMQEANTAQWTSAHEEIFTQVVMAAGALDPGRPPAKPRWAPPHGDGVDDLTAYGFRGDQLGFEFVPMVGGDYLRKQDVQEMLATRGRELAVGGMRPYAYIGPDEGGLHYACYSPAGPGRHQPVFTAEQMLAAVEAGKAGAPVKLDVVQKGGS